jgi:hypothetical protein
MLRLAFESETVEFLLPNAPGRCRAGGKKSRVRYRAGRTRRMHEIRRSNTTLYDHKTSCDMERRHGL